MNTNLADGASERLGAQIADALFGQPGMSKMDVANRLRELRCDWAALLVQSADGQAVMAAKGVLITLGYHWNGFRWERSEGSAQPSTAGQRDAPWPEIDMILPDAYSAGAEGLQFEGIARGAAVRAAVAALAARPPVGVDLRGQVHNLIQHTEAGPESLSALLGLGVIADPDVTRLAAVLQVLQPVGQEPVGYLYDWTHSSALGRGEEIFTAFTTDIEVASGGKGGVNIRPIYATPPAQSVGISTEWVLGYFDTDVPERARDAVRYAFAEYASLAALEPKPAQAVDLGQFRKAVEAWKRDAKNRHHAGDIFPEQEDAIWKEADRLLTLIDSQAVHNA